MTMHSRKRLSGHGRAGETEPTFAPAAIRSTAQTIGRAATSRRVSMAVEQYTHHAGDFHKFRDEALDCTNCHPANT